jgi:hypothetical protein
MSPKAQFWWCVALVTTATLASPRPGSTASLQLFWSDQRNLLKDKLLARGYETMTREVAAILADAGIHVSWSPLTEKALGSKGIVVVLTPAEPTNWGLPAGTLGTVMGRDGPIACVYMFYPAIARMLRVQRNSSRSTRDFHVLGKAIGRVASHEIVHAMTPELPHSGSGLMMANLTRNALRQSDLRLSTQTATAVSTALMDRSPRR